MEKTGYSGFERPVHLAAYKDDEFAGYTEVQISRGQLHIKMLYVEEKFRSQGIGRDLMVKALEYGKNKGSKFAYVETFSFQAPEFYKHFGFEIKYTMDGFPGDVSFHYLKMDL
jgi:ribosomal protein S18 acetylase RimI-like enzyme